ncbi:YbgF trimerization domain-containing protein [Sphingomonas profundi]|uniref:YbgF trimerization domain-containing protein n=1 Tax=Alterirhizorhabdus profundi TaxID=2681549 RepID=UPI0012E8DA9C|nr:YbgF trimerization domain-containing protein [Sphingomonas profundi]
MRLALIAALLLAGSAAPVFAQEAGVGQRVDRLEKEMRAVQRKVFPGGTQQFLEADIGRPAATPTPTGVPASSPVEDLSARVSSLEQELARLTGQIEQNGYKVRQLEEQFARFKADADARLNTVEGNAPPTAITPGRQSPSAATPVAPATPPGRAAAEPAAPPAESASVDPGEDAYLAGYRLWEQKKYAEAATALKDVVAKYPKHRRASYAQNLLGRAYLDDGKPGLAAEAFYANYQKMPRGDRAPDSLYYLGQSLMSLKPAKAADACKVYAELIDVYGEKIAQPLKDRVAKARADAKCGA